MKMTFHPFLNLPSELAFSGNACLSGCRRWSWAQSSTWGEAAKQATTRPYTCHLYTSKSPLANILVTPYLLHLYLAQPMVTHQSAPRPVHLVHLRQVRLPAVVFTDQYTWSTNTYIWLSLDHTWHQLRTLEANWRQLPVSGE